MEFPFRLPSTIGAPSGTTGPYIGCLDDKFLRGMTGGNLMTVLDTVGKRSAIAQGLKKPVTYGSACSLLGQRIYLMVDDRCALGFIKVGSKRLFVAPPALHASRSNHTCVQDAFKEINPLCVLDFYVHESCQRTGYGRRLFDTMLEQEGVAAAQLAYDRPSPKLLPFLAKHFGLKKYQPQNNNFVIFDEFYARSSNEPRGSRSCSLRRGRSGDSPSELGYGGSGRGILPGGMAPTSAEQFSYSQRQLPPASEAPSLAQRPPLMPSVSASAAANYSNVAASYSNAGTPTNGKASEVDFFTGIGAPPAFGGRPPSLSSNSRPPLGAPPMQQRSGGPGYTPLQTPWGTAEDAPTRAAHHGRRSAAPSEGGFVAGMPSGGKVGKNRSVSMPCRGHASSAGSECSLPGLGGDGYGSTGGGTYGSSRRYASPLSHAGHRMLEL